MTTDRFSLPLTPYRVLQAASDTARPLIPEWASQKEVFRSQHRTRYVVESANLDEAKSDLAELRALGWDITIQRLDLSGRARITMAAGEIGRAA